MDSIEVVEKQFFLPEQDSLKIHEKMQVKGRIEKLYVGFRKRCREILEDDEFQEYMEKMVKFLKANPLLACGLFAVLIGIVFPVIIFILFVIANIAFVIAGFIILEVTVFIIGATVVSCSVFFVITTVVIIGLGILTFYLIFSYLVTLVKKRKS